MLAVLISISPFLGQLKLPRVKAVMNHAQSKSSPRHSCTPTNPEPEKAGKPGLKKRFPKRSTALQDLSANYGTPDGVAQNANLVLSTAAMREVTARNEVLFVDAFNPSSECRKDGEGDTVDGALLNERGYRTLAPMLADAVLKTSAPIQEKREAIHAAVMEKSWAWLSD